MMQRLSLTVALCAAASVAVAQPAPATYPTKLIRVMTTEPGGGSDFNARLISQALSPVLGQQIIVENRPGSISTETVVRAAPDGYTLLFNGSAAWLLPFLRDNVPYEPLRDLAPITISTIAPSILVVHPSLPVKSVKELIALARARPGELNYAAGVMGAPPHLAGELFIAMAKVKIVRINYKGTGAAMSDLIGGQVQVMFPTAGSVIQHVRSGRLRGIAVTSAEPSRLVPGLPTVGEALPGFESSAPLCVFAPVKTPAALIARLNQDIVKVLHTSDVKDKFFNAGVEVIASTPAQLAARIKHDQVTLGKLIKDVGIRAD